LLDIFFEFYRDTYPLLLRKKKKWWK
jgi:hypothetical protein